MSSVLLTLEDELLKHGQEQGTLREAQRFVRGDQRRPPAITLAWRIHESSIADSSPLRLETQWTESEVDRGRSSLLFFCAIILRRPWRRLLGEQLPFDPFRVNGCLSKLPTSQHKFLERRSGTNPFNSQFGEASQHAANGFLARWPVNDQLADH